ncbi:uncharacterized protein [Dermacentor albipictus]|uniref:uncharacterized protein n=1 Tax=Dermacentor albipictus TaxID=60249 RepID=UPI0038FC92D0
MTAYERMHGTAKRSGKEPLQSWNVPQRSAYNERMHGSPECSAREPLQQSFPRRPECDDNAQSDLPGLWPCVNRTPTPSSGHYDCRSQPFEHEHLGLERRHKTSTHARSPLTAASQPRNDFSRSGSYGLSRASFPTADVLSTPTSRPTSRSVSTVNGPSGGWPLPCISNWLYAYLRNLTYACGFLDVITLHNSLLPSTAYSSLYISPFIWSTITYMRQPFQFHFPLF